VATGYGPVFDAGSVEDALRHLDGFRILSPLRAGPYGIRAINHWVTGVLELDRRIQSGLDWYRGQPILVLANDHNLRLYNGDLGVVWPDENGVLTACFRNADGSIRRVGRARLPLYETAYAMTVHKSQGSEFGEVLLILPDRPSPLVTRELVYTGLTRARRKTEVWTKETIFRLAVATPTRRASGLKDALIKK
jgi:exodeoxyribonuclease V alpha subunit